MTVPAYRVADARPEYAGEPEQPDASDRPEPLQGEPSARRRLYTEAVRRAALPGEVRTQPSATWGMCVLTALTWAAVAIVALCSR